MTPIHITEAQFAALIDQALTGAESLVKRPFLALLIGEGKAIFDGIAPQLYAILQKDGIVTPN